MAELKTTPISGDRQPCGIERVEEDGRGYMCGLPSRIVWHALPDVEIPVCRQCRNWLDTLLDLGLIAH